jgi:hypothetical protein
MPVARHSGGYRPNGTTYCIRECHTTVATAIFQKDIERFCPKFAVISAKGDSSHPSRAIVSGLVKVGSHVCSTHKSGNLWLKCGYVPPRLDYGPAEPLRGTGEPQPIIDWRNR